MEQAAGANEQWLIQFVFASFVFGGSEKKMTLSRRHFLHIGTFGVAAAMLTPTLPPETTQHTLRIALLHLAPLPGDLTYNRQLVETAVTTAAGLGANWIVTPELCICGYTFVDRIGTGWIVPQPDPWMAHFCQLVARLQVTVFLSHPERDRHTAQLHNTVFVIAANGTIVGKHRKINTLRVGSEAWSSPGELVAPLPVHPLSRVGILICADAYSLEIARSLQAQGAQLLVSAAAWAPGLYGPHGEWEQCTRETGLPLLVCNRTGTDRTLDFTAAESVIVKDGQRLLSFRSERSAIFMIEWDLQAQTLARPKHQSVYL
jgi:predicted amidohydrolase